MIIGGLSFIWKRDLASAQGQHLVGPALAARGRLGLTCCLVLLCVLVMWVSAAPAVRAAAWITPGDTSLAAGGFHNGNETLDSIAVSPRGNMVVGWVSYDKSSNAGEPSTATVHLVRRLAGGPAEAEQTYPETVSSLAYPSGGFADIRLHLRVAVNDEGDAVATWIVGGTVKYVQGARGGAFGSRALLPIVTSGGAPYYYSPAVGIDSDGTATIVWGGYCGVGNSDTTRAWAARIPVSGQPPDTLDELTETGPGSCGNHLTYADFSIDELPDGRATVGFFLRPISFSATPTEVWSARRSSASGAWTATRVSTAPVGSSERENDPVVATEPGGAAITAWVESSGVKYLYHPRSGADVAADAGVNGATEPSVAMGADGEAFLAYLGTSQVWVTRVDANGAIAASKSFASTASNSTLPVVAANPAGAAVVAWRNVDSSGDNGVAAAVQPPGGPFGSPTILGSDVALWPAAAADGLGDFPLVWLNYRLADAGVVPHLTVYDGAGPQVTSFSAPSALATGQAGAFSATESDVWSAVLSSWSFDDGGSFNGPSGEHSFAAPGSRVATLNLADSAGNATTRQATVDVAPPDSDGDGIRDASDTCPTQSDLTAQRNPRNGCPAPTSSGPHPTNGNDVLNGTAGADVLCGLLGNDALNGLGGNDTLFGDSCGAKVKLVLAAAAGGNDVLNGGDGNDKLFGAGGNDALNGGKGNDKLFGGGGNDKLNGGPGTNIYSGGSGNDTINARNGKKETVNCGSGKKDKARVDKRDKTKGCEKVERAKK